MHVIAEREESKYVDGRPLSASSECELAAAPGNRYYARFKTPDEDAIVASDGNNIWRALASKKQWTKLSGASLESGEEENANSSSNDLHAVMRDVLLYHFWGLAKKAEDPVVVKEEDFKLGHAKLHGYLLRGHTGQSVFEMLVDRQSFLVVSAKEQRKSPQGTAEVATRLKQLEIQPDGERCAFFFRAETGLERGGDVGVAGRAAHAVDRRARLQLRAENARRCGRVARGVTGQGSGARLLGHLVRAVPRRTASR